MVQRRSCQAGWSFDYGAIVQRGGPALGFVFLPAFSARFGSHFSGEVARGSCVVRVGFGDARGFATARSVAFDGCGRRRCAGRNIPGF